MQKAGIYRERLKQCKNQIYNVKYIMLIGKHSQNLDILGDFEILFWTCPGKRGHMVSSINAFQLIVFV